MKTAAIGTLLVSFASGVAAGADNPVAAAREAVGGSIGSPPTASILLGGLGAAWLGYAGLEDGQVALGALLGFALGATLGLVVHLFI